MATEERAMKRGAGVDIEKLRVAFRRLSRGNLLIVAERILALQAVGCTVAT